MTILTQSDEVVGSIATSLSGLKMMDVQLNSFLSRATFATMLASITVPLEYILTDIIFVVHFPALIIRTYRQRLPFQHCFKALCVKLSGLDDNFGDGQPTTDAVNGGYWDYSGTR